MEDPSTDAATLVIRVWFEGDPPAHLRARIVAVLDGQPPEPIATVATPEDLHAAVRSWVQLLTDR